MQTPVMSLNGMAGNRLEPESREGLHEDAFDPEDIYQGRPAGGIASLSRKITEQDNASLPPEKAIPLLFERMKPYRKLLLAIIDFCQTERLSTEIDDMLEPLSANRRSPYSPIAMRGMLERSGAIEYRVPQTEESQEDIDETGCLIVTEEPEGTWISTAAGLSFLREQDALADLRATVSEEPTYTRIYEEILEFCAQEGRTPAQIGKLVDDDPLLEKPKRCFDYFLGRLEDAGGLEWSGTWKTTANGKIVLLELKEAAQ